MADETTTPDPRVQPAFDDAIARLTDAQTKLQALYNQFATLKTQGAELEKQIFQIEGELKALSALGGTNGH